MTLHGYDISHWQAGLDLDEVHADFVIMKATDGTSFVDSTCDAFYTKAKALGMLRGVYHFYQGNPTAEADFFLKNVDGYLGDAVLALDFEDGDVIHDLAGAKAFCDRVRSKTGVAPLLYMSQSVANQSGWAAAAKDYGLWVARYNDTIGPTGPWDSVVMWQHTSSHHDAGFTLDEDIFYGDRDTWAAYATGDDTHTSDDTTPDDKGDDDMPAWKSLSYADDWTLPADGEWRTIPIGKTDDGGKDYSFLWGPKRCTGTLNVALTGLDKGHEVDLRPIVVETKKGQDTRSVKSFPLTEFFAGSGSTQLGIPFTQDISAGTDGWSRRLRFQIRAYGGEKATVTNAHARAIYWEK